MGLLKEQDFMERKDDMPKVKFPTTTSRWFICGPRFSLETHMTEWRPPGFLAKIIIKKLGLDWELQDIEVTGVMYLPNGVEIEKPSLKAVE